jgi:hypothetical protein
MVAGDDAFLLKILAAAWCDWLAAVLRLDNLP